MSLTLRSGRFASSPFSAWRGCRQPTLAAALLGAILLGLPGPAAAQDGFGIRGGATIDPDQGFVGMHFITPIAEGFKLHPSAEIGFGDDLTLASVHIDFASWFELGGGAWSVYIGGGPSVNFYRADTPIFGDGDPERTDVDGSFDAMVGFASQKGLLFEIRIGTSGGPDLRFTVGYTF